MSIGEFLNPQRAVRAARIEEGMTVADFGAGAGFFTRAAARAVGPSGIVWAVDAHREGLARVRSFAAAERLFNIELSAGSIEERGGSHLPDESMDLVIAANVLFSLHHHERAVEELWRVLKPRGRALIIDWSGSWGGLGPQPEYVVPKEKALALFEKGGFERVARSEVPAGNYHWGLLLRKKAS